jgi:hypothetical protein
MTNKITYRTCMTVRIAQNILFFTLTWSMPRPGVTGDHLFTI